MATIQEALAIAIKQHQVGQLAEAEANYRGVLAQQPTHAQALFLLGTLNHQLGRSEATVVLIGQALTLNPQWPEAYANRGEALRVLGRLEDAVADQQRAVNLRPSEPRFLYNLGLALKDAGRLEQAMIAYRQAIAIKPDYAKAWGNLGNVLREMKQLDEAIAAYRKAVALKPDFAEAYNNLGIALRDKRLWDEAVCACQQALALQPNFPQAYSNLGNALRDKGLMTEAVEAYRQALSQKPDFVHALGNLGSTLKDMGHTQEAIAAHRRAVSLEPESPEGHYSLAFALLLAGQFEEGWVEHEWRLLFKDCPVRRWSSTKPQWDGSELNGRRILLFCEQGFGDIIQFARYVPAVAQRGGHVILMCPTELRRLFDGLPGVSEWVLFDQPMPSFDVHCALMSLPLIFGTTMQTIPAPVSCLRADFPPIKSWRDRLASEPNCLKIGLVWAGRPTHANDHNRSISLSRLAPLAKIPGVVFYSLQKGEPAAQAKQPPDGMNLVDWTSELTDFADTAALIANLDLVISVDSAVAHLTGCARSPIWLLAPFVTDWRWPLGREDSPWYPTMKIFRQESSGQWDPVITRLAESLARLRASRD